MTDTVVFLASLFCVLLEKGRTLDRTGSIWNYVHAPKVGFRTKTPNYCARERATKNEERISLLQQRSFSISWLFFSRNSKRYPSSHALSRFMSISMIKLSWNLDPMIFTRVCLWLLMFLSIQFSRLTGISSIFCFSFAVPLFSALI